MAVLAFETSCDETSVAVVEAGRVLANVTSSQVHLHAEYGGVVPELAAREHLRNLPPLAREALARSEIEIGAVTAVAATRGPGLPMALLVGFQAAQAAAFALRRPFLAIHHHEAHLYSPWVGDNPLAADFADFESHVSLIVSGGHTLLIHVRTDGNHRVLGSTLDDAAGECFDKSGKLMGLGYPAGPEIDRLAHGGNATAHNFPRPLLTDPSDDFSFSGLKTAVRYFLRDHPGLTDDPVKLRDLCASVQTAIVEVLVTKTVRAARRVGVRCVTASGGVACNRELRRRLRQQCEEAGLRFRIATPELCTDNAAMVGLLAERRLAAGLQTPTDTDIEPSWELSAVA